MVRYGMAGMSTESLEEYGTLLARFRSVIGKQAWIVPEECYCEVN
jgi:hypothetical protein